MPENTLESLSEALAQGADGVEYDVQISSDGIPFLLHDTTLLRTCGIDRIAHQCDATFLASLEVGAPGCRLPFLERTLQRIGGIHDLEIKAPDEGLSSAERERLLLATIPLFAKAREQGRISMLSTLTSFDLPSLDRSARLDPALRIGAIVETPGDWRAARRWSAPRNPSVLSIAFPLASRILEPGKPLPEPFSSASLWLWNIPEDTPDEILPWRPDALIANDPAGVRSHFAPPDAAPGT